MSEIKDSEKVNNIDKTDELKSKDFEISEVDKGFDKNYTEYLEKNKSKEFKYHEASDNYKSEIDKVEKIKCRNEELDGKKHPETGVPFEKRVVEADGKNVEVVVPKFESLYDAQLTRDLYKSSDTKQFKECNDQLKSEVKENKKLQEKFTASELEQIENGDTPDGYTWHHDADEGKMQLVDTKIHTKTGHTGGRAIWGGGTENR